MKLYVGLSQLVNQTPKGDPSKGIVMSTRAVLAAAAAVMVLSTPALATDWIYQRQYTFNPNYVPPQPAVDIRTCSYPSASNQCPGNLVPVMMGGSVSCGVPNTGMCSTYTPAAPRVVYRQPAAPKRRVVCPVGEKGCYTK